MPSIEIMSKSNKLECSTWTSETDTVSFDAYPFVSVIMPIRNEVRYIERSLSIVLAQDYPSDRMEIIVIDGCSDDVRMNKNKGDPISICQYSMAR